MDIFDFYEGKLPLLISIPHCGLHVPDDIKARMTEKALELSDTDWHLPELLRFARDMGASVLAANYSRYVIDLNRPPDDVPLYKGATTGLVSPITFDGEPLYMEGEEPDGAEKELRREKYWQPYHDKLATEIEKHVARHGAVVVFEAHSIRSVIPRLFEGVLPDLNFGTNSGESADAALLDQLVARAEDETDYTIAANGRFKGGYITRHYGNPAKGVQTVQLEMAQVNYMREEMPFDLISERADRLASLLKGLCADMIAYGEKLAAASPARQAHR
ncbi:MAG: N-formylglutamate deformylase [Alphaproteobacteria bacterium]|nr:MAG: N-formylglutamate deformylase [Alphaproteobacteria bacterium]